MSTLAEDRLQQMARSLRRQAIREKMVGPRFAEGWSLVLSSSEFLATVPFEDGSGGPGGWTLSAKHRESPPPEAAVVWLAELARILSGGKAQKTERVVGSTYYVWREDL